MARETCGPLNYSRTLKSMLVWTEEIEENENLHLRDGNFN